MSENHITHRSHPSLPTEEAECEHIHFYEIGIRSFGKPDHTRRVIEEFLTTALDNSFGMETKATLDYVGSERFYPEVPVHHPIGETADEQAI